MLRIYDPSHNMNRRGLRRWQWLFLRSVVEVLSRLGCYSSIYSYWRRSVLRRADMIRQQAAPEVIVATYPPVETLEIGLALAKKFEVPLVADFRDGLLFEPVESRRLRRFVSLQKKYKQVEAEIAAAGGGHHHHFPLSQRLFQKHIRLQNRRHHSQRL